MTGRDLDLLVYIDRYVRAHGLAPTFDEIGAAINVKGRGAVFSRLRRLETQGLIERVRGARRGIRILHSPLADRENQRRLEASAALLHACELQQKLIRRMLSERHFPVFISDKELMDAATEAAEFAIGLARPTPPDLPPPTDNPGDPAHA